MLKDSSDLFWENFPNFIYLKAGLNNYIFSIISTSKRHRDFSSSLLNVHIIVFICSSSPHHFQELISYNLARNISKYCILIITFVLWLEEKGYVQVGLFTWCMVTLEILICQDFSFRVFQRDASWKSHVYAQKSIN